MGEWYYARNNQRNGPVTMEQLKQLGATGQLSPGDLVWKDGMASWAAASTIPGLMAAAAPAPAPSRPAAVQPMDPASPLEEIVPLGPRGPSIVDTALLIATRAVSADLETMKVADEEKGELAKIGVTGESAQRYLVWRRSMLWVALVPLAIGTVALAIDSMVNNFKPLNAFGVLVEVFRILTMLALPAAAALGAVFWAKPRLSQLIVMLGMIVCFVVPLLILILPHAWLAESKEIGKVTVEGSLPPNLIFGILIVLLSLAPGLVRGCLRARTLLPESPLPALILLGAAPVSALLIYAVFLGGGHNLIMNLFALFLLLAPICYLIGAKAYLRPIATPADRSAIALWQWIAYGLGGAAALMAIIQVFYVVSKDEQFDMVKRAYGSDTGGFYFIWTMLAFFLDYLGRSLFVSVFAAHFVLWATRTAKSDSAAVEKRLSELEPFAGKL